MVGRQKAPTSTEKQRMALIKEEAWCICCVLNHTPNRPYTTIHHPVEGNKRVGTTMGLCGWHHQGHIDEGWTRHDMQHRFGASLAHGSKPFVATWAPEAVLVQLQDYLIELWTERPWESYNLPRYVQYEIRKRCNELRGLR